MLPPPHSFHVEVYSNWQPVIRRCVGEELDAIDALDALEWGVLPIHDGVDVRNRCLANDLQLQEAAKPRRAGK